MFRSGIRNLACLLLPAVFLALSGTAHARSSYLTAFNTAYGTSATKLNSCSTCHGAGGTSTFNPYGQGVRNAIGSGISAALTAVEPLDSDGDGHTNIAEITARTYPGDPADFPAPSDTTPPTVSSTTPTSGQTGVAANTAVTATFSEPVKNVSTATFTLVPAAGGAAVNGSVTVNGTTATFTPSANFAYSTSYRATVTTGVMDLANNALAANYSWTFSIGAAPDTSPPTVSSTNPANGATGVAVNAAVTATFSEAVKSVSTATFTLAPAAGGASLAGSVTLNGTTATFAPSANLAYGTTYRATVTTGVMDLANNPLAANYSWTFSTGAATDTTPPAVSVTSPVGGATAVSVSTAVTATFSEAVKNVTTATFTLAPAAGGASVAGSVTLNGTTATFAPSANLAYATSYRATVTTGVMDLANNPLAANYGWTFTTGTAPDTAPPTVGSTNPASGATGVAVNAAVTATFSETVKNVGTATFQLRNPSGAAVNGSVILNGTTATFTPSASLAYSTTYTATLTTGVTDLANNALAANYSWTFSTGAATDTVPPTVSATNPASAATGVAVNASVTAVFSETIDTASVNATTFNLKDGAGASVAGVVTATGNGATFTPSATLDGMVTYTATLTTGVKDLAGNTLPAAYSWSFTTTAGSADSDNDGITDTEDDYPNDARKATPSCPTGTGKFVLDTSKTAGTQLASVEAMSDTAPALNQSGKPSGFNFDHGLLAYRVEGVAPGATIEVKITFPENIPSGSRAFKVDSSGFHEFSRVSFHDRTMTVTLTDGGEGDADGSANGVIVDPIGVAAPASLQAESSQAAGGGCSISGAGGKGGRAAGSYGTLLLLAAAMLGVRAVARPPRRP